MTYRLRQKRYLIPLLFGGSGIVYSIFDTYPDNQSAPLTTPRTLTNGFVTVTGESRLSISSGSIIGTEDNGGVSGLAYSDNASAGITITDGQLYGFTRNTQSSTSLGCGFRSTTAQTGIYTSWTLGTNYATTLYVNGVFYNFAAAEWGANIYIAYLFDNSLCYIYNLNMNDITPVWELRMIVDALVGAYYASIQLCINAASGTTNFKQFAMRDNVASTLTKTSVGTSAGSTATAPSADFVTYISLTTLQTGGTFEYRFRIQDANNYWRVTVNTSGDIDLSEVVTGTPTSRASSLAVVADGETIVIQAYGTTINVWADANRDTYTSATNFQTATGVELESLGTDGVVAAVDLYEYYPTGGMNTALNSVVQS